jgi:hypothetical protein
MPPTPPDIAALYLATIVTIHDEGSRHPAHQVAARRGTLHVITAWNPGDERPSREENDRANRALRAELEALSLDACGLAPWAYNCTWPRNACRCLWTAEPRRLPAPMLDAILPMCDAGDAKSVARACADGLQEARE